MTPDLEGQAQPKPAMPTCGHCGAGRETGAPIAEVPLQMGPTMCKVYFCGNPECGAIYNIVPLFEIQEDPRKRIIT